MGARAVGIEFDRPLMAFQRLLEAIKLDQDAAQIAEDLGVVGLQCERTATGSLRLGEAALPDKGSSAVEMRLGELRQQLDSASVALQRGLERALQIMNDAQMAVRTSK